MRVFLFLLSSLLLFLLSCKTEPISKDPADSGQLVAETLPMKTIALEDLSAFSIDGKNWQIAGDVYSDYQTDQSMELTAGTGVLVNNQTESEKAHLRSNFEHGDMELDIEFMMPKGSNSGIYFQGRYEVQLFDSWKVDPPLHTGCGAIYERWDESRPEGQKGYEGHAPRVNASKAPGLWQHYQIFFRAPRFDANGNKIKNATFEKVVHNGIVVHENVEVTGPTRAAAFENDPEVPFAPMVIQGDHGKVAFRNIKYKAYTQDSLQLSNISYKLYDYPEGDVIPNFDSLKLLKEGNVASLEVEKASTQQDHFALVFQGDLEVPVTGDYLFNTLIDDGGDLFIDGKKVVHNQGEPGMGSEFGMIHLNKGKHNFELNFYEEVWTAMAVVFYEGPGIYKRTLASVNIFDRWQKPKPVLALITKGPELLRGFVSYGDEKRTHAISVGDPAGLHYCYDLNEGSLLKFWRNGFADVTQMWQGRGIEQLGVPVNPAVEAIDGTPVAQLNSENANWPQGIGINYKYKGYDINVNGHPVFKFNVGSSSIEDQISPSADKNQLVRSLSISSGEDKNMYTRVARAGKIQKLPNNLYSIGGQYYLSLLSEEDGIIIRNQGDEMEMLLPIANASPVKYALLW